MNKITLDLNNSVEKGNSCSEGEVFQIELDALQALQPAANIVYSGKICKECGNTQRYRQSFDDVRTPVYFISLVLQKVWHPERLDREVLSRVSCTMSAFFVFCLIL
jgi:hypothetical protein